MKTMLEQILGSRIRSKILVAFFQAPGVERNAWVLAQELGENYSAVWKELGHLEQAGVLTSQQSGKARIYTVDPGCPIISELRAIVMKTAGVGAYLRDKLAQMGNVQKAFIYGSFAAGKADNQSDLDLMIIGGVDLQELSNSIAEAEKGLNRPINYVIFSEPEWNEKLNRSEPFAVNVNEAEKIVLIGADNGL